ncbi:hypothetical protein FRC07_000725 [Ceratobasidium sp. 392]|nr:hypothetical protein FRC07_000725 [Ceratobasidium sp. 392]
MSIGLNHCSLHKIPENHNIFLLNQFEGKLEGPVTSGGNADLYSIKLNAIDPPRKIAIKCFRPRPGEDDLKRIIENELRIWKILNRSNNPNVAPFLGVIESHEYNGFVGTYIPPSPICEHYHNRDLDYSNVLVNDTGTVAKICDFGSSRITCPCHPTLEDQSGTLPWDSPELYEGEARTSMSDIWAFGCLALEAQFGQVPYNADFRIAFRKMRKNQPPAMQESVDLEDPISRVVWEMMQKCWEFDPKDRPSAQVVLDEFEALAWSEDSQPANGTPQVVAMEVG